MFRKLKKNYSGNSYFGGTTYWNLTRSKAFYYTEDKAKNVLTFH